MYETLFLGFSGELFSILILLYYIDRKRFGRKKSLVYLCVIIFILYSLIFLNQNRGFAVTLFLARFFYKTCISIHVTLCNELFPTPIRVLGNGFVFSFGRLAGSLAPFVAY